MLILSRRPDESVCIGPDIRITVLGVKGNQVRLGITAPKDVVVDREEVHKRKQCEAVVNSLPTCAAGSEQAVARGSSSTHSNR